MRQLKYELPPVGIFRQSPTSGNQTFSGANDARKQKSPQLGNLVNCGNPGNRQCGLVRPVQQGRRGRGQAIKAPILGAELAICKNSRANGRNSQRPTAYLPIYLCQSRQKCCGDRGSTARLRLCLEAAVLTNADWLPANAACCRSRVQTLRGKPPAPTPGTLTVHYREDNSNQIHEQALEVMPPRS